MMGWLRNLWWKYDVPIVLAIAFFMFAGFLAWVDSTNYDMQTSREYEVWDAQAPFGHYWVQTGGEGGGSLLYWRFEMWSDLRESYTVKYIDNSTGELKTVIFPSAEWKGENGQKVVPHIILKNENITPEFRVVETWRYDFFGPRHYIPMQIDYYLTLPDPKVFG